MFNQNKYYKRHLYLNGYLDLETVSQRGRQENVRDYFCCFLSLELILLCSSKYQGESEPCSLFCVIRCDMRAALINSD